MSMNMESYAVAIEWYHKALGLNPDDTFSAQMLLKALKEEALFDSGDFADDEFAGAGQKKTTGKRWLWTAAAAQT